MKIGTTTCSDEWRTHSTLNHIGNIHKTVNHSKNFIDSEIGAHIQIRYMETYKKVIQY